MKTLNPSQYHSGTVALQPEELGRLRELADGKYVEHFAFQGVEVCELDIGELPPSVLGLVEERGGRPTSFAVVKVAEKIPKHRHSGDGEIYFMGTSGTVTLFDASGDLIEEVPFNEGVFTATNDGESHAIQAGARGTTFFAVKFTVGKG